MWRFRINSNMSRGASCVHSPNVETRWHPRNLGQARFEAVGGQEARLPASAQESSSVLSVAFISCKQLNLCSHKSRQFKWVLRHLTMLMQLIVDRNSFNKSKLPDSGSQSLLWHSARRAITRICRLAVPSSWCMARSFARTAMELAGSSASARSHA